MSQFSPDTMEVDYFEGLVMRDNWEEVATYYKDDKYYHTVKVMGRATALHVAVSNGEKDAVKNLVDAILHHHHLDVESAIPFSLRMLDERRGTPLHIAAYRGFTGMCEYIIGKNGERKDLVYEENEDGQTPLFWAVLGHRKRAFVYLYQFAQQDVNVVMDKNGTTILHVAIRREMFGLAYIIMHCYADSSISSMKDEYGVTPLEELATRTSAFKSGSKLSWWMEILCYCYPLKLEDAETKLNSIQKIVYRDKNDQTGDISIQLNDEEEFDKEDKLRLCYWSVFRWPLLSLLELEKIESTKKKRLYGAKLLEDLTENPYYSYMGGGHEAVINTAYAEEIANIKNEYLQKSTKESGTSEIMKEHNETKVLEEKTAIKDTIYLVAAKHGIVEITSALVSKMKSVIHDRNSNNENVLLSAVKHRQPQIVEELRKSSLIDKNVFKSLCQQVDIKENTMLHLAAYTSLNKETTWRISGPAMQMMWDIKWYKYIKRIVPTYFKHRINTDKKTPGEIFKEEHEELLQKSTEWLKDTAESCSVVAALIAGLSFATSGSVPGGNDDSGKPALEGQPAFEGFAISSLIGLYFSGTALIMFLSILTSRKQIEDFSINLPTKLLAGLTSLFVSIVAMFISFCAGHFFVLTDKYGKHDILFYLYIVFSFPVIFYAAVQLPLYIDLLKVIWKKVPPSSVKGVDL